MKNMTWGKYLVFIHSGIDIIAENAKFNISDNET